MGCTRRCLLGVALLATLAPGVAHADSLVFIKDGNVHLTDGTRTAQVTQGGNWESPSQADDGTIVAVRVGTDERGERYRYLIRMDRRGRELNPPVETLDHNTTYDGPMNAKVSPDGRLVAFHWFASGPILRGAYFTLSYSDRSTPKEEIETAGGYINPSWLGSSQVLLFNGSPGSRDLIQIYDLSAPSDQRFKDWFEDEAADVGGGEISAQGDRFVASVDGTAKLRFYSMNGPPPAAPTPRCEANSPQGGYLRPTFSPDGSAVAWQQPDGIHIGQMNLDTCQLQEALVVPGGSYPDFGPAGVPADAVIDGPGQLDPEVAVTVATRARRSVFRRGLPVKVGCDKPCTITVRLRVGGRVVGRATKRLTAAGTTTLRPRARLRRGTRRVRVTVTARGRTFNRTVRVRG